MCLYVAESGFGAEREQLNEGAEEAVQPVLVGHALLHHFLLARVLSCLLNGVGLGEWDGRRDNCNQTKHMEVEASK